MRILVTVIICFIGILPSLSEVKWHSVKNDYYLQRARNSKMTLNQRVAFYDSILASQDPSIPFSIYCEQASLYENEGLYLRALEVYRKARKYVLPHNLGDYSRLLLNSAIAAYHSNRMREAIGNIYELEFLESPDSLRYYNMDGYRLLSFIMSSVDNDTLASHYLDLAWKEFEKASPYRNKEEKERMMCRLHFAQSEMYLNFDKTDMALEHLRKARGLCKDSLLMSDICGSLGRICEINNDVEAAEEFYREAINWTDMHPNKVVNIGNYVYLLLSQRRLGEAGKMIKDNEPLFEVFKGANVERYIEKLKYGVAKATGNKDDALKAMERLFVLDDSVKQSQSAVYIKDLISEFEDRSSKDYQDRLINESRNKTTVICVLAILMLIVITSAGILYFHYKKVKRGARHLEKELSDIDEENLERRRELEENVEQCNKEMMSMSMRVKKMNEWFDGLCSLVKNTSLSPRERIEKIESSLDKMGAQNNVQKMFGVYFSRVNSVFFNRLFRLHPELSPGEIRMCGYMQLGLTSKEIANLTNRSVRTVDNIKYSIRKKMGITEPTESYIRRVSTATELELRAIEANMKGMSDSPAINEPYYQQKDHVMEGDASQINQKD